MKTVSERVRGALAEMSGVLGAMTLTLEGQRPAGRWTLKEWARKLRCAADKLDEGL